MAFLDETGLAELWKLIGENDIRVATGSYVGVYSYGHTATTNDIVLPFAPKLMFLTWGSATSKKMYSASSNASVILNCEILPTSYESSMAWMNDSAQAFVKKSEDGKTISFKHNKDEYGNYVFSNSENTYHWMIFGYEEG